MPSPPLLADYPVILTLPVQWGDQDAFGHVNNTVPIRWMESARIAYMERMGWTEWCAPQGLGPILAAIHCNYRRQINFPDTIQIGARVTRIGRTSFTMEHACFSDSQQAIVADGDSVIVVFDYASQKPTPMPADLRQAIEAIEGKPLPS